MQTLEEFQANQQIQLVKFQTQLEWKQSLPIQYQKDASVCLHDRFVSVILWSSFNTTHKTQEVLGLLDLFQNKLITCEHWRNGCVSTYPREINKEARKEKLSLKGRTKLRLIFKADEVSAQT